MTLSFASSGAGWDASADMGDATPGRLLELTITYSNWTVHGSFPVEMIETPTWMQSFLSFPGGSCSSSPRGADRGTAPTSMPRRWAGRSRA